MPMRIVNERTMRRERLGSSLWESPRNMAMSAPARLAKITMNEPMIKYFMTGIIG